MAKQVKLIARPRTVSGRNAVKTVRARGAVPAVIYGARTTPSNLEVTRRDIEIILSHSVGENILVDLEIQDGSKVTNQLTLIQEVQHHPIRRQILHVDFHAVSMTDKINAEISVEPFGESDGVKNFGGLLEQNIRSVSISCLPQNLPELIKVDISAMKVGDSLHVRDLVLPEGVEVNDDADLTVFIVAEPKVAEATPASGAAKAPEVIKEKKVEAAAKK
jgi:large subunit ribosomal protein L25